MNEIPQIVEFSSFGSVDLGYISVAEKQSLPFIVKRIYWTYYTPQNIERGHHAHKQLEQILIAVAGTIDLQIETKDGSIFDFHLDSPNKGVYIPNMCWRTMRYSHNAVQMCLASMEYNEEDYIRDYDDFQAVS
jgi:hypothetical protein